jgi:hypothetical protein
MTSSIKEKGPLVQANDLAVGKHYVVHSVKNCPPESHPVLGQALTVEPWNSSLIWRSKSTHRVSLWLSPMESLGRFGRIESETLRLLGFWRKRHAESRGSSGKCGFRRFDVIAYNRARLVAGGGLDRFVRAIPDDPADC